MSIGRTNRPAPQTPSASYYQGIMGSFLGDILRKSWFFQRAPLECEALFCSLFFLEQLLAFFHTITNARNGNYSPRQEENIRRRWKAARCGDKPVIFGDEVNSDLVLNTQSRSHSGNFFLFLCRSFSVLSRYSHTWWAAFIEVLLKELILPSYFELLWNTRLNDHQNIQVQCFWPYLIQICVLIFLRVLCPSSSLTLFILDSVAMCSYFLMFPLFELVFPTLNALKIYSHRAIKSKKVYQEWPAHFPHFAAGKT